MQNSKPHYKKNTARKAALRCDPPVKTHQNGLGTSPFQAAQVFEANSFEVDLPKIQELFALVVEGRLLLIKRRLPGLKCLPPRYVYVPRDLSFAQILLDTGPLQAGHNPLQARLDPYHHNSLRKLAANWLHK